jgi:hypothetical protein
MRSVYGHMVTSETEMSSTKPSTFQLKKLNNSFLAIGFSLTESLDSATWNCDASTDRNWCTLQTV